MCSFTKKLQLLGTLSPRPTGAPPRTPLGDFHPQTPSLLLCPPNNHVRSTPLIVWHYLHDPTFSHFDTIPECDRHTHRHTDRHDDGIYRAIIASRGKKFLVSKKVSKICKRAWWSTETESEAGEAVSSSLCFFFNFLTGYIHQSLAFSRLRQKLKLTKYMDVGRI